MLFINHGVSLEYSTVEDSTVDAWRTTLEGNFLGAYHCARLATPHLRRRGGGNIIVVGSGLGHRGGPAIGAYACSKAALWMLVRVLAAELREDQINVNELPPRPGPDQPRPPSPGSRRRPAHGSLRRADA